jgi:hypothetical protein
MTFEIHHIRYVLQFLAVPYGFRMGTMSRIMIKPTSGAKSASLESGCGLKTPGSNLHFLLSTAL